MFRVAVEACNRVFDIIVPVRCALCGEHGAQVCAACQAMLARAPLLRRPGGRGVPEVFALGSHDGAVRAAVLGLKYRNRREAARSLGTLLGCKIPFAVNAIVPVPLHESRFRARGFNQAEVIACGIASAMSFPVVCGALRRARATTAQSSLALRDRAPNVRGAFVLAAEAFDLVSSRVLIVDDVVTTGATIAACADALRSHGIRHIVAAALALRR